MTTSALPNTAKGQPERTNKVPDELIFVSNRAGNHQIYLKNLISKRLINLSRSQSNDMNPQVSPDGKKIVFYSDRSKNNQIYEMEITHPGKVKMLTHNKADEYDPVFMPDGLILYKSDQRGDKGLGDIWIMNANGSRTRDLTAKTPHTEQWKPEPINDHEILYTTRFRRGDPSSDELFRLNLRTDKSVRLTKNDVPDWFPAYSPNTKKIAFASKPNPQAPDAIYEMGRKGNYRTKITDLPGDSDDPSWSPDGKYITFVNNSNGNYDIYAINSDGTDAVQLDISPAGNDLSPVFVPQK